MTISRRVSSKKGVWTQQVSHSICDLRETAVIDFATDSVNRSCNGIGRYSGLFCAYSHGCRSCYRCTTTIFCRRSWGHSGGSCSDSRRSSDCSSNETVGYCRENKGYRNRNRWHASVDTYCSDSRTAECVRSSIFSLTAKTGGIDSSASWACTNTSRRDSKAYSSRTNFVTGRSVCSSSNHRRTRCGTTDGSRCCTFSGTTFF